MDSVAQQARPHYAFRYTGLIPEPGSDTCRVASPSSSHLSTVRAGSAEPYPAAVLPQQVSCWLCVFVYVCAREGEGGRGKGTYLPNKKRDKYIF